MKDTRNTWQYKILFIITKLIARIPEKQLYALANFIAAIVWYCLPARRKVAIDAIKKHLHFSLDKARLTARRSFTENIFSFLQIFHVGDASLASCVSKVITPVLYEKITSEKIPVVITTAHMGSWEFMAGLAADALPDRHGMVVVRSRKNSALNILMADLRGARGMQAIDHRRATDIVMPELRKNGLAAFLVDHNASRKEAVFLPFLEDTAAVNMGPAMLALRAKAVVYPVFLVRDYTDIKESSHLQHPIKNIIYLYPPLYTTDLTGSITERVEMIAKYYTDAVADIVKKHPEQWFWMHKRWKTRKADGK